MISQRCLTVNALLDGRHPSDLEISGFPAVLLAGWDWAQWWLCRLVVVQGCKQAEARRSAQHQSQAVEHTAESSSA